MSADRYEIELTADGGVICHDPDGGFSRLSAGGSAWRIVGAIRQQARDIESLRAELAAMSGKLSDLLAILLRDGGHYESEHGTEKAIDAAKATLFVWREAFDERDAANAYAGELNDSLIAVNAELVALEAEHDTFRAKLDTTVVERDRLAREIDAALRNAVGCAAQPRLCDLVGPVRALRQERDALRARLAAIDSAPTVAWLCTPKDGGSPNATAREDSRDDYARFGRKIVELIARPAKE